MIKRNKRNIGKIVEVTSGILRHRKGKIMGFRGDYTDKIPFVNVFIYDIDGKNGTCYPLPANMLKIIK